MTTFLGLSVLFSTSATDRGSETEPECPDTTETMDPEIAHEVDHKGQHASYGQVFGKLS